MAKLCQGQFEEMSSNPFDNIPDVAMRDIKDGGDTSEVHVPFFFGYKTGFFSFQNNPKALDPSCKTDLELWHCLGRVELVL